MWIVLLFTELESHLDGFTKQYMVSVEVKRPDNLLRPSTKHDRICVSNPDGLAQLACLGTFRQDFSRSIFTLL